MIPVLREIDGSDLSGSNNTASRTYTIPESDYVADTMRVVVNGMVLHETEDFTVSTLTLTFVGVMNDDDKIQLDYFKGTATGSVSTDYCTAGDVAQELLKPADYFSASTAPTETQVNNMINAAEDKIDRLAQHSWRSTTVTDEFYSVDRDTHYERGAGVRIKLRKRNITSLSSGSGDKLEIWNGNEYDDWLSTKTEGRSNDFWLDYNAGWLFLRTRFIHSMTRGIRLTYRYGESSVPEDIREACAQLVAVKILLAEYTGFNLDDTGDNKLAVHEARVREMKGNINRILASRKEIFTM